MSAPRRSLSRSLLAGGVLAFALGGALSWYRAGAARDDRDSDSENSGDSDTALQALRTLTLPDSAGRSVAVGQFRDRLLIVNFWATWCAPCVEEMPELSALALELSSNRLQVIGIGVDSAAKIAEFARKHQISYPLLVAGASAVQMLRPLGNTSGGLPFTLVIGRDGQIKHRHLGRLNMSTLRNQIAQLAPR